MYYFRYPTQQDFLEAEYFVLGAAHRMKQEGLLTKKDMERVMNERGIWNLFMKLRMEELRRLLRLNPPKRILTFLAEEDEVIEKVLLETLSGRRLLSFKESEYWKEEIKDPPSYKELQTYMTVLRTHMQHTIEEQSDEAKLRFLVARCTHEVITGKRAWNSVDDCLHIDIGLMNVLGLLFARFLSGFSTKIMRLVARSPEWHSRWTAATQTGSNLFQGPIIDWNVNQLSLCYWSMFYDNLAQDSDAPQGDRIQDDELVDGYLRTQRDRRERDRTGGRTGNNLLNKNRMGNPEIEHRIQFKR